MQLNAVQETTVNNPEVLQASVGKQDKNDYRFPVALEPAYDARGNKVPKTRLVVRQDSHDVLATVSERYRLITHEQVMDPVSDFTRLLGKSEVKYSLERNGAKLMATHTFKDVALNLPGHKMPGQKKVGDTVALRTYSINSYNTTTPFEFKIGGMVLRCLNGATAFDSYFELKFKHVGLHEINFPKPEIVLGAFQKQGATWSRWADTGIEGHQIKAMVEDGFRLQLMTRRAYQDNTHYFEQAETVWDLYNAFTYVVTHSTRVQETGKVTRFDRLNNLFNHRFAEAVTA